MTRLIGILGVVAILVAVGIGINMWITYDNRYNELTNLYDAQDKVDQVIYDEVWKVVQQEAGITAEYSKQFRENYTAIMSSRNYGGEMMKWITEQNPNFTPGLYERLMNTLESQRAKFTDNQKKLIAIHKELKDLTTTIPGRWFVGGRPIKEPRLVTSTRTDKAFDTGKDDDVDLFPKKE